MTWRQGYHLSADTQIIRNYTLLLLYDRFLPLLGPRVPFLGTTIWNAGPQFA